MKERVTNMQKEGREVETTLKYNHIKGAIRIKRVKKRRNLRGQKKKN